MSLGLRAGSKLHELFGLLAPYGARKLQDLAGHARAYAKHHHVDAAFRSYKTQRGWHISFHPAAPEIIANLQGGYVVLDARTLEVGPGYHAFVVGFLDYLTRHHQWVWELRAATRHFVDDTGYAQDRNFAALQTLMAGEFTAMCQGLVELEAGDRSPQNVWLPQGLNLATDRFAATSLGFRDRTFFEDPKPECFFPWWEQGATRQAVKNLALSKMWLDVVWEPPTDARERQDLENARALIDRAHALGAALADDEGTGDINALLRGEPLGKAASIGYSRQDVWYLEPGGWSIALPACFREEIDADGQLCSLLTDDRAVYVRSHLYEAEQTQLEWPDRKTEGYDDYLRFKTDRYWAVLQTGEIEEDGDRWFVWEGTYNSHTGSALVRVVISDKDDAAWAEKVLRSVQPDRDSPVIILDRARGPEDL